MPSSKKGQKSKICKQNPSSGRFFTFGAKRVRFAAGIGKLPLFSVLVRVVGDGEAMWGLVRWWGDVDGNHPQSWYHSV